jgi:hypothetical protein
VARGDAVDGVVVVRDPDAAPAQLVPESYRPRSGDRRRDRQPGDPRGELLRRHHRRLPEPLAARRVEGGEDLAAVAVEDRQALALGAGLGDPGGERVEGADAAGRQAGRSGEAVRGCDPDPQAGEGAGPEPDRDQIDRAPAAGGLGAALDLAEQAGRVARPSRRREPEQRLVQNRLAAPGAGGGVGGRGVEADYGRGSAVAGGRRLTP